MILYTIAITLSPLQTKVDTEAIVKCCFNHGNRSGLRSEVSLYWLDDRKPIHSCANLRDKEVTPDTFCSIVLDSNNCRTITIVARSKNNGTQIRCYLYTNEDETVEESSIELIVVENTESTSTVMSTTRSGNLDTEQRDGDGNLAVKIGGKIYFLGYAFSICM